MHETEATLPRRPRARPDYKPRSWHNGAEDCTRGLACERSFRRSRGRSFARQADGCKPNGPLAACQGAAQTLLDWRLKVDEWARAEQRRIDQDRDRNRQEFVALLNSQMWGYWNDPQFGVWSLMKRQDEERFRAAEATRQQLLQQQLPLPILQTFSETAFQQLGASGIEPEQLRRWLQERGTDQQVRSWNEALHSRHPSAGPGRTDSTEGSGPTPWGQQPPDAVGRPDILRELKLRDPGSVEQVESLSRILRDSDNAEPRTAAVQQLSDTPGPPDAPLAELERDERARQRIRSLIEETNQPRPNARTDEPAGGRRHELPEHRDGETTRQLDEQDRRHAEITKELHQKLWEYWNDPVIGFFPWLRRQLEEAQRKTEAAPADALRVRENRPSRKDRNRPIERHEVLQHAFLKILEKVTDSRGSGYSGYNTVIELPKDLHQRVNTLQREARLHDPDRLRELSALEVIERNLVVLRDAGVPTEVLRRVWKDVAELLPGLGPRAFEGPPRAPGAAEGS
jgi:hypothetical protein